MINFFSRLIFKSEFSLQIDSNEKINSLKFRIFHIVAGIFKHGTACMKRVEACAPYVQRSELGIGLTQQAGTTILKRTRRKQIKKKSPLQIEVS